MLFQKGDRILFIGDSVTDCGRERPVGVGLGLGNGYVADVAALLGCTYPELGLHVMNTGTSGDQVRHLKARWQTDVFDLSPDWVFVMIGINDVWRQFDRPTMPEQHVLLPEYEATLDELVGETLPKVRGMVLMTPYFIEPLREDAMRARMDEYGEAVKRVAQKHGVACIDTQAGFDALLAHQYSGAITWDRVHPGPVGHMALARMVMRLVEV